MNNRQKKFAQFYALTGNAAEAARLAGYSETDARRQGCRLLTNVDVLEYVQELQEAAAGPRVASIEQVKATWSDIMRNTSEKSTNRLRAGELLVKSAGGFHNASADDGGYGYSDEEDDVVIFLPSNGRPLESAPTYQQDENGNFIKLEELNGEEN